MLYILDDMSLSSISLKSQDGTPLPHDPTSRKRDEVWCEYEGDVSSNNENSLTSEKSERVKRILTHNESLARINESTSAIMRAASLETRVRQKRHPPPPPRPKHKQRQPIELPVVGK